MTAMSDAVLIEEDGPVRILTMNRPEALNAFDGELHHALPDALHAVSDDPKVRALVLTGAGRAFSAGGNIDDFTAFANDLELRRATLRLGRRLFEELINVHLPVIAAVNGPAVGLGCTIATACDAVIMSDQTFLADPHVTVALVAGDGGAVTWPLNIGLLRAKPYLLTGDRMSAEVAVSLGLATRAVPPGAGPARGHGDGAPHRRAAAAGRAGHQVGAEPAPAAGRRHGSRLRPGGGKPVARHPGIPRGAGEDAVAEGIGRWISHWTRTRSPCRACCANSSRTAPRKRPCGRSWRTQRATTGVCGT